MKIELTIPDHRPVISEIDALDEDKARLLTAWRILDALVFAAANKTCPVDAVLGICEDDGFEPSPGAYARLEREKEELQDKLDDIRRVL